MQELPQDGEAAPAVSVPATPSPPPTITNVAAPAAILALTDIRFPPQWDEYRAEARLGRGTAPQQLTATCVRMTPHSADNCSCVVHPPVCGLVFFGRRTYR